MPMATIRPATPARSRLSPIQRPSNTMMAYTRLPESTNDPMVIKPSNR